MYTRQALSALGCLLGIALIVYGSIEAENMYKDDREQYSTLSTVIVTLVSGSVLVLQACCLCAFDSLIDRRMNRLITSMESINERLRDSTQCLTLQNEQYEHMNRELAATIDKANAENGKLRDRNEELEAIVGSLRQLNEKYNASLSSSQRVCNDLKTRLHETKQLYTATEEELQQLRALVVDQREQIEALKQQAENLNRLQRESVRMIQDLALYGNECQQFGVTLSDISKELRATDDSLGLTATEMQQQLDTLNTIISTLEAHRKDDIEAPRDAPREASREEHDLIVLEELSDDSIDSVTLNVASKAKNTTSKHRRRRRRPRTVALRESLLGSTSMKEE